MDSSLPNCCRQCATLRRARGVPARNDRAVCVAKPIPAALALATKPGWAAIAALTARPARARIKTSESHTMVRSWPSMRGEEQCRHRRMLVITRAFWRPRYVCCKRICTRACTCRAVQGRITSILWNGRAIKLIARHPHQPLSDHPDSTTPATSTGSSSPPRRLPTRRLDAGLLGTVFAPDRGNTNCQGRPQWASAMQHLRTTPPAAPNLAVQHPEASEPTCSWLPDALLRWPARHCHPRPPTRRTAGSASRTALPAH